MRLYLSSFRMGACPALLRGLAGGGTRAVVIANAADGYPPADRDEGVEREVRALADAGFEAVELDLRAYFDGGPIEDALLDTDLVWVRGGDVFTLRFALHRSGADRALVHLLSQDAVAYGGYSAGICVLGPSLRGLEAVDDPARLRSLHHVEPMWEGLGLLAYRLVPHVDSPEHPETVGCGQVAAGYQAAGIAHRTLRDGEVLVIDGEVERLCTR